VRVSKPLWGDPDFLDGGLFVVEPGDWAWPVNGYGGNAVPERRTGAGLDPRGQGAGDRVAGLGPPGRLWQGKSWVFPVPVAVTGALGPRGDAFGDVEPSLWPMRWQSLGVGGEKGVGLGTWLDLLAEACWRLDADGAHWAALAAAFLLEEDVLFHPVRGLSVGIRYRAAFGRSPAAHRSPAREERPLPAHRRGGNIGAGPGPCDLAHELRPLHGG
jgi:hypothetical protein